MSRPPRATPSTCIEASMGEEQQIVNVYTDGACKGNPGIGGWGAWLKYGEIGRAHV